MKQVLKSTDMEPELLEYALQHAMIALQVSNTDKGTATYLKVKLKEKDGSPNWHCIVGRKFGAYVTHETKNFAYFYIGQTGFLVFKTPN